MNHGAIIKSLVREMLTNGKGYLSGVCAGSSDVGDWLDETDWEGVRPLRTSAKR